MTEVLQRSRTGGDIVLGALLVVGALVIFGNVILATTVSVVLVGWCSLLTGLAMVLVGLFRLVKHASWSVLLGGVALAVVGLVTLRNLTASAVVLTLVMAAMLLATGLARILIALELRQHTALLITSGVVSVLLGLWIILNPGAATLTLLGTLVGLQVLLEGITMILSGRLRLLPLTPAGVTPLA